MITRKSPGWRLLLGAILVANFQLAGAQPADAVQSLLDRAEIEELVAR